MFTYLKSTLCGYGYNYSFLTSVTEILNINWCFSHLYRASWCHQSYLFTNECTSDCLKNNIKIYM